MGIQNATRSAIARCLDSADDRTKAKKSADKNAMRREKAGKRVADVASMIGGSKDYAANLAHYLVAAGEKTTGRWSGPMAAADQKTLFGRTLGKGTIVIDGENEVVEHYKSVGFGMDYEVTATIKWRDL